MAEPTFYTTEELKEIKNKIKSYMMYKSEDLIPLFKSSSDDIEKNCIITALIALDAEKNCMDEKIIDAYSSYPPFMFYTDEYHSIIKRIYGFAITEDGEIRAHTVCAMMFINNDTIGGTPIKDCIHVKYWSSSQIDKLKSGMVPHPEAFLEQNGYMQFAR